MSQAFDDCGPDQPDRDELAEALAIALAENAALRAQNAALLELVSKLEARVAELERRLGLDSSNSSKPPSSDGPKKPTRVSSLRQPSGKKSGGQKGHKGETLRRAATPDEVVDHHPSTCSGCGAALSPRTSEGHAARQVFDLPKPQPLIVTEHRAHVCRCESCGETTRAKFPEGVDAPVQYGARIAAFVVYLLHYQFIPVPGSSPGTGMSRACASRLEGFAQALRDLVAGAEVKHMDETGFRIPGSSPGTGKTQWLHVACTSLLTFYRVCAKRGALLSDLVKVVGVIVHDHWKPYYTMDGVRHALCNAHHLRELKALVDIEKEDWARQMQILLRRACHAANLARERGVPLEPRLIERIKRRYDLIVAQGLAFHEAQPPLARARGKGNGRGRAPRRTGHNLLARLAHRREDVLRFLDDPSVPFTNNQAEGDVRMTKVKQKISGGFHSQDGAEDFATIRSVISTARKQGWNILQTLSRSPDASIQALRVI